MSRLAVLVAIALVLGLSWHSRVFAGLRVGPATLHDVHHPGPHIGSAQHPPGDNRGQARHDVSPGSPAHVVGDTAAAPDALPTDCTDASAATETPRLVSATPPFCGSAFVGGIERPPRTRA